MLGSTDLVTAGPRSWRPFLTPCLLCTCHKQEVGVWQLSDVAGGSARSNIGQTQTLVQPGACARGKRV